jgi:hypothetical protein
LLENFFKDNPLLISGRKSGGEWSGKKETHSPLFGTDRLEVEKGKFKT